MTNPTLERAARALYELGRPNVATANHWNLEWSELGQYGQEDYRIKARAVLMAVRDSNLTVHKVPATVDGAYADIVTIRNDGVAAIIQAILNDGEGE